MTWPQPTLILLEIKRWEPSGLGSTWRQPEMRECPLHTLHHNRSNDALLTHCNIISPSVSAWAHCTIPTSLTFHYDWTSQVQVVTILSSMCHSAFWLTSSRYLAGRQGLIHIKPMVPYKDSLIVATMLEEIQHCYFADIGLQYVNSMHWL